MNPYTKALLDARIAEKAKEAYDSVFKGSTPELTMSEKTDFSEVKEEAKKALEQAIADGTWRAKCKGRDLLKTYCGTLGITYEHFRNILIERMKTPPKGLADIMERILKS